MVPSQWLRGALAAAVFASGAVALSGCDILAAALPQLGFCGATVPTTQLAKLAEGPAYFIDAVRVIGQEVGAQANSVGSGVARGFDVSHNALDALGPYQYQGSGAYQRDVASDRAFRLRFYYGDAVPGKTSGAPLEADLTQLGSYLPPGGLPALLDPSAPKGPLFPLLQSTGLTSGNLQFRDTALRFDLASLLKTTMQGYAMQLSLGTQQQSLGSLVSQLQSGKVALSLADTAMTNPANGFSLAIKQFDVTYDMTGSAQLGGNYLFQVSQGPMSYFGAVQMVNGSPVASLRCTAAADTEFATMSFTNGRADFKMRGENFPITLPGLAPAKP